MEGGEVDFGVTMTSQTGSITFLVIAAAVFGALYWRLFRGGRDAHLGPGWLFEFSPDRYAILGRMLAGEDYDWIERQTGGDRNLCKRLRSSRRKAFRRYLAELSRDFARLQCVSKMIALDSPEDETELARFLVRQAILFRVRLLAVHLRLALSFFRPGNIEVGQLIDVVHGIHGRLFWLAAGEGRSTVM